MHVRVWRMRSGISITVNPADRLRLEGVVRDRNAAQKHVWRAAIVLLSADGVGTTEIMRRIFASRVRWYGDGARGASSVAQDARGFPRVRQG